MVEKVAESKEVEKAEEVVEERSEEEMGEETKEERKQWEEESEGAHTLYIKQKETFGEQEKKLFDETMTVTTVVAEGSQEYTRIADMAKQAVAVLHNFNEQTQWEKVASKGGVKYSISKVAQKWRCVKSEAVLGVAYGQVVKFLSDPKSREMFEDGYQEYSVVKELNNKTFVEYIKGKRVNLATRDYCIVTTNQAHQRQFTQASISFDDPEFPSP